MDYRKQQLLTLNKSAGAIAIAGNLELDESAIAVCGNTNQFSTNSIVTVNGSAVLQLSGKNQIIGGVISIVRVSPTRPAQILKAGLIGTNLVFSGTNLNGGTNFHFLVLAATILATPLTNWTVVGTNPFNADGSFSCTSGVSPARPTVFFNTKAVP